jgi:hypothetical protein
MNETQAMTQVEGEALLNYLRGIPEDKWDTQTVCDPWSARHLVAHLTALGNQMVPNFAKRMVTTGFNFQNVVDGEEFMCHGEDIRRALGDRWEHPHAHVDQLGPNYAETGKPLNGKSRTKDLSFRLHRFIVPIR